jgi:hypothetical protein
MTAATFQSTVNIVLGFGIPGELIVDGPQRVDSLTLDNIGGTIGFAFTKSSTTDIATQGGVIVNGTNLFAGILVNPKVYASFGAPGGSPLDPTLFLGPNTQGEFLTMGTIVVTLTGAANIGDNVQYNETTGALSAIVPGGSPAAGYALVPNAVVWQYPQSATGLAAIRLTN